MKEIGSTVNTMASALMWAFEIWEHHFQENNNLSLTYSSEAKKNLKYFYTLVNCKIRDNANHHMTHIIKLWEHTIQKITRIWQQHIDYF